MNRGVRNRKIQNKNLLTVGVSLFVLACAIVVAFSVFYFFQVRTTVKNESKDYLKEISIQISKNISRNINDNFSALQSIAVSLEDNKDLTFIDLSDKVAKMQNYWEYNQVLVIDGNGNSYNKSGDPVRLNIDEYLNKVIIERKPSMSSSEIIDGQECFVFAIPVNFEVEDKEIKALVATYSLVTFDKILSMTAFNNSAYAHIIRSDGRVIIKSSSENAFDTGYNILNTIDKQFNDINNVMPTVRKNLIEGSIGFCEISINKNDIYMTYLPLEDSIENGSWRLVTFVPLSIINVNTSLLLKFTLYLIAFIAILFTILFGIIFYVSVKNKKKLENIAYVDDVTGGNTIKYFYEVVNKTLSSDNTTYAMLYTNLEKFKLLNEQYGRKQCDAILKTLNDGISHDLVDNECVGRLFADNFCILIKYTTYEDLVERIKKWKNYCDNNLWIKQYSEILFTIEFGAYVIDNSTLPLSLIIDRAKLALSANRPFIFGNIRLSIYNDAMRKKIVREKLLEDMMEKALAEKEFKVFLQPKYSTVTDAIEGAEALVRWSNPNEGMIYPNEFIPLFERNGFIKKLDLFVFDCVCALLKKWIDDGMNPIKISVNCSREHLKEKNFLDSYEEIANKYGIPKKYLEIEFTENIVFEDVKYFSDIIDSIHEAGFGCSMDDFGSGYSSLSMIQDIPVDTIKLDKVFFSERASDSALRTEYVVESIINMSKALSVTTVAEGVEDEKQVKMLKKLGCDLIQGFYYSKPLPITQFEKLAANELKLGEKI